MRSVEKATAAPPPTQKVEVLATTKQTCGRKKTHLHGDGCRSLEYKLPYVAVQDQVGHSGQNKHWTGLKLHQNPNDRRRKIDSIGGTQCVDSAARTTIPVGSYDAIDV